MLLLIAGIGGVGTWQWERVSPHLRGMKAAIAASDFGFLSKENSAPSTTDTASSTANPTQNETTRTATEQSEQNPLVVAATPGATGSSSAQATGEETGQEPDILLNHRRYEVASEDALVQLNPNSQIKLQPEAQAAVTQMIDKAKAEGVRLGIISGFRTLADQDYLYFDVKAERGQDAQTRAEVSAPPGYSEHHTGYAVDFIDEGRSETHLQTSFETTAAFKWLEKNAAYYNFELSFPKGNATGVAYEPWHWRYVGNQESLELFYK